MGTATKKIAYFNAQKKIALLWLSLSAILFLVILIMSLTKYNKEDYVSQLWNWFLPNIVPTLSLMLGIFVSELFSKRISNRQVPSFYFGLTFYLSLFYLIIFFVLIAIDIADPIVNLIMISKSSSLYLGPLQGLVTISIGLFFKNSES